jgi:hypothetical protein
MKYEDIKDFNQRCEEHPDHQTGMISERMIQDRLSEEIDELREYIEQRTWVGLTDEDRQAAFESMPDMLEGFLYKWGWLHFSKAIEAKLREKNA